MPDESTPVSQRRVPAGNGPDRRMGEIRADLRLDQSGVLHAVDEDPAPDLDPGPEHPLVGRLRQALEEHAANPDAPVGLEDIENVHEVFLLGYQTAIYDLRLLTSEPTAKIEMVQFAVRGVPGDGVPVGVAELGDGEVPPDAVRVEAVAEPVSAEPPDPEEDPWT